MGKFRQIFVLTIVIAGLQVCTGGPIGSEVDVTKLFTGDELRLARNAGISDRLLIEGNYLGLSLNEMIELTHFFQSEFNNRKGHIMITFNFVGGACAIIVPGHKTATNYTSDQEAGLQNTYDLTTTMSKKFIFYYLRTTLCDYVSDPFLYEREANSFGLELNSYLKFSFWKLHHQNATGVQRVNVAKELCCIYKGQEYLTDHSTKSSLSDEQMTDFVQYWNEFKASNTSKSFERVCDFLQAANPAEEC